MRQLGRRNRRALHGLAWSLFSGLVATFLAAIATGMASRGFEVPPSYAKDGLLTGYLIRNTMETGWFLNAPRLGYPFDAGMYDFPIGEYTNVLFFRLLAQVFSDYGSIYSAFYLGTFLVTGFVTAYVLLRLRITPSLAVAGGIVFALLPYHLLRAHHLFLSAYWVVPVYAFLALRGFQGMGIFGRGSIPLWILLLLLAGGAGIYYAFFGCLLLGAAALIEAVRRESLRPLGRAAVWTATISLGVAASLVPHFLYWKDNGRNSETAARQGVQSERYALKPIQLFLPTPGHRVPILDKVQERYAAVSPFSNDNRFASLGLLGAGALVVSLVAFFFGRPRFRDVVAAGRYNTMALLYAAVGGLGSAIAYTVLPEIRATNRISVFIGFFCTAVLVLVVQRLIARKVPRGRMRAVAIGACAVALVGIASFDQIPAIEYGSRADFVADRTFFRQAEALLPAAAKVLQLPHVRFPEGPQLNGVDEYNHLRAYLHTNALRFSFAVMKGRPGDKWLCALHSLPAEQTAAAAAASGYDAILVATSAYPDDGAAVTAALTRQLGPPLLNDRGLMLFGIPSALKSTGAPLVAVARHKGFFGWEQWGPGVSASRATGDASVQLVSPAAAKDVPVTLVFRSPARRQVIVERGGAELARVTLEPDLEQSVPLRLDVAKGTNILNLKTDAPPTAVSEGGSRPVSFSVAMAHCPGP